MAYKKITELEESVSINDADLLEVVTDTTGTPTSKNLKMSTVEDWVKTFAAQESTFKGTVGNIMSPLLDLPLKNSLAMRTGVGSVHFERSTTATYVDRYGVVQTANIDEPRFEEEGLLIEGASTNLLMYSEEFDNAVWSKVRVAVTANAVTAPDGTITANKIEVNDNSGYVQVIKQFVVMNVTQDITNISASVFVKKGNENNCILNIIQYDTSNTYWGETDLNFNFDTKNLTVGTTTNVVSYNYKELKDGWFRLSLTVTAMGTDTNAHIYTRFWVGDRSTLAVGQNIYVWGAQLEKLPFASSYIPTTDAAVTRAADICYVDYKNNCVAGSFESSTVFSLKLLGILPYTSFLLNSDFGYYRYYCSGNNIICNEASVDDIAHPVNDITKFHIIATTANLINIFIYIDRENVSSGTYTLSNTSNSTKIYIGSSHNEISQIFGHIKNLKIYDKCLTPLEVSLL